MSVSSSILTKEDTILLPPTSADVAFPIVTTAAAMRQSELGRRGIADAIPAIVWMSRPEGGALWYNRAMRDYTNLPTETMGQLDWQRIVHPDDLESCMAARNRAIATESPWEFEYRLLRHDGQYRCHLARCVPIRDADGSIAYWLGTATDIDDLRLAQAERDAVHDRTQQILDGMSDSFVAVDANWRILHVNEATAQINSRPAASFVGEDFWQVWWAAVGTPSEIQVRHAMTAREAVHFEVHYVAPDLDVWGETDVYPSPDGGLNIFFQDISERKRSEMRTRRLFESNIVGVIQWNLETSRITDANDLFLDMVGYTREEMTAGLLDFRRMTPPEWTERNAIGVATIREKRATPPYEKEYFHKDGARIPILIGGALYEDSNCEGMSYVLDIRERKQSDMLLRQSEERYRLLTLATNQIVWITDAKGSSNQPVPLWGEFTGQSFEEYCNWGWMNAIHPDDRSHVQTIFAESLRTGDLCEVEYRLRRHDGTYRAMLVRAAPVRDANGIIVEWIGADQDIQQQKDLEAQRAEAAARNERIAETLQRSLLLMPIEDAFPGLLVATIYESAWEEARVGGDFCDVFALDEAHVALVVGDVSGKGLNAAARTVEVKFALRAFLREETDPARALARLNRHLCVSQRLEARQAADSGAADTLFAQFVALTLIAVDTQSGVALCASAGAEPPILVRALDGEAQEIAAQGMLLGAFEQAEYATTAVSLREDDLLVLATDGITEARDGSGSFFGVAGLTVAAQAANALPSLKASGEQIVAKALDYANGRQADDVCLLLARRREVHEIGKNDQANLPKVGNGTGSV